MGRCLVTGGAGFIGSHICVELSAAGHNLLIIDNFSNSSQWTIDCLKNLPRCEFYFQKVDLRNSVELKRVVSDFKPEFVVHLAGLKSVEDSVKDPLAYYENNIGGSLNLLEAMSQIGCNNIVFSSSATVYGSPINLPIDERHATNPVNPYGRSKLFVEQMIADWQAAKDNRHAICLRYFNPIGAHPSGKIGELPSGIPKNIFPYLSGVAAGRYNHLKVFGTDYETRDGTGERDYIHIMDLARAHSMAVAALSTTHFDVINVGTGTGTTVNELIHSFERATGQKISVKTFNKRPGDVASCFADSAKAFKILGWKAQFSVDEACQDQWRWEKHRLTKGR